MKKFLSLFFILITFMAAASAKDFRFVQISDTRFSNNADNSQFKEIIKDINRQKDVQFVIFTGDNIAQPSAETLKAFLGEAKKLKVPFYIVIGDKDVNKLKHLSKADYIKIVKKNVKKYKPEKTNYVFENDNLIFIVADGAKEVIPGTNGYYKYDVLNWLDIELTAHAGQNVFIFQHFPIIPPSEKESYYTFKPENYLEILSRHKNVKAVISGHFDVNSERNVNGITHITTASVPYYRIIDIMDYETENTPEFPYNWKKEPGNQPFVLEMACSKLQLIFKDSGNLAFGKAEVKVDGKHCKVCDPLEAGWTHCHATVLLDEDKVGMHRVEISMAPGEEEKLFTILGFAYVR